MLLGQGRTINIADAGSQLAAFAMLARASTLGCLVRVWGAVITEVLACVRLESTSRTEFALARIFDVAEATTRAGVRHRLSAVTITVASSWRMGTEVRFKTSTSEVAQGQVAAQGEVMQSVLGGARFARTHCSHSDNA